MTSRSIPDSSAESTPPQEPRGQSSTDPKASDEERLDALMLSLESALRDSDTPQGFLQASIQCLVDGTQSEAGLIWRLQDNGSIHLFYGRKTENLPSDFDGNDEGHLALLGQCFENGESTVINGSDLTSSLNNSKLYMVPVFIQGIVAAVIEVFAPQDLAQEKSRHILFGAEHLSGLCTEAVEQHSSGSSEPTKHDSARLEEVTMSVHRSLMLSEVANVIANDGRHVIDGERTSVFIRRGASTLALAISGQDKVNRRAPLVKKMERLAKNVIDNRMPVVFAGRMDDLSDQQQEILAELVDESGLRSIVALPLAKGEDPLREAEVSRKLKRKGKSPDVFGCLLVEWRSGSVRPEDLELLNSLAKHSSLALANAADYHQIFLLRLWKFIGRTVEWFHGKRLWILAAVVTLLCSIGIALALVPWRYRVKATGELLPAKRANVFAPESGKIAEILVESGQRVEEGQLLLQMSNEQVAMEIVNIRGELRQAEVNAIAINSRLAASSDQQEVEQGRGEVSQLETQIRTLTSALERLEVRQAKQSIRAPKSGIVVTYQLQERLRDRPVNRGELLLEIMDDQDEWQLELKVPAERIDHLLAQTEPLDVSFTTQTDRYEVMTGSVRVIAPRPRIDPDQGSVFEVVCEIDNELVQPKVGVGVTARIDCGKRSLGYVLFGDFLEYVRSCFWL